MNLPSSANKPLRIVILPVLALALSTATAHAQKPTPINPDKQGGASASPNVPDVQFVITVKHNGKNVTNAHIVIKAASGAADINVKTGMKGTFQATLPAGGYTFTATKGKSTGTTTSQVDYRSAPVEIDIAAPKP